MTALLLPGLGEWDAWQIRKRTDRVANAFADRHYPRRSIGCGRVGGPNRTLVLVTGDELAVWISAYSQHPDDGLDAWRCQTFRNEGRALSSDLIRAAMDLTAAQLGEAPPDGWVTYVDTAKVRSSNPGCCFKKAGWWLDRLYVPDRRRASLIRLRADA